ncbi:putative bifunctional diguanylate cyclase/phosphodiesterase [Labrys wisconsinensis]|uniref:Diguanylate cyclase (GGDEF)-like protein/PAS domain S-box-containing protein n=1 Tax=Labrys wisconsinensis TaxID=425677 RepID=A0ABU0IYS5_9HYPH|nr:EAL domain-containing protein [Labrys wisconsinensis]MDQ0467167.1 diguanylate cyclase (GGDEF)-like protein/PAS domain S-box-containing protein [Labrys wisconsinensis]
MALVDSLYAPFASLVVGAVAGGLVGAMASYQSRDPWLTACSAAIFLVGLARVLSALAYRRRRDPGLVETAHRWERVYELGAWSYSGLLGLQCLLAVMRTNDPALHLVVSTLSVGYAAGITGRNAGRPYIAVAQLTLAAVPLSIGLYLNGGTMQATLATVLLMFVYAMIDITLSIRDIIVQALVTTRDKAELAGRYREQANRFDAALTNMSHGLCMFDRDGSLVVWNERFLEVTGLPAGLVRAGVSTHELMQIAIRSGHHSHAVVRRVFGKLAREAAGGHVGQTEARLTDGRTISLSQRAMPEGGSVVIFEDITARKEAERIVARMARYDELTGLANRRTFHQHTDSALARLRGGADRLAVHWIDLDRFKSVNDTLGHPVGDGLLRAVADRLRAAVRDTDVVARFGGDEFVIMQYPIRRGEDASRLARRLMEALSAPFQIEGHHLEIGASAGIAIAPRDGMDGDRLLKNADLALYRAKADGRGAYRLFEPSMDAGAQARRALELDLRHAWERGEFEVHYQPLVELSNRRIAGCEALVRWRHPSRGWISPLEFIPVAEETGLIVSLGEWVLNQACVEATAWPKGTRLAVNLSPVQFKSRSLGSSVVTALAKSGLPASRLELEVTEMVLLQDSDLTLATMTQLRQLGVRLSLDDFGTGYSSLSYLRKYPFEKIKIDSSFVKDIGHDAGSAAIVRAVASLGRDLGMSILVEGIETTEQFERVKAEGCTEGQGYLFGRPVPSHEIREVLRGDAQRAKLVA